MTIEYLMIYVGISEYDFQIENSDSVLRTDSQLRILDQTSAVVINNFDFVPDLLQPQSDEKQKYETNANQMQNNYNSNQKGKLRV